jgi:hypothetical protein
MPKEKVHIITVATKSQAYFPALKTQASRLGLSLTVLGWQKEWKGFAWRWNLLEQHLRGLDPDDIAVFVDAYDVLPVKPVEIILKRFHAFKSPLVLSVESEPSTPVHRVVYRRLNQSCKQTFVNGGLYMGRVWALLQMIDFLRTTYSFENSTDDQVLLSQMCNSSFFEKYCALDVQSKIFCNLWGSRQHDLQVPVAEYNKFNARDTCFIHCPANSDMSQILRYYGVDPSCCTRRGMGMVFQSAMKSYAHFFYKEIVSVCILCLLCCWCVKKKYIK